MLPPDNREVAVPARGSSPTSCPVPPAPPGPEFDPPMPAPDVEVGRGMPVDGPFDWEGTSPKPAPVVAVDDAPGLPLPVGSKSTSSVVSESVGVVPGLGMFAGGPPEGKCQQRTWS